YHGTDEAVLQIAVGHIEGSSLPVGGEGTHCVISGHRGLPSAKLFTDLDQLQEGDIAQITVLDETLTYEIDQIRIVLPNELEELAIDPKKDLLTMVTCTPYGINSHRMLVRGHRIDNPDAGEVRVTSDASQIEPLHVLPAVVGVIAVILLIWMLISSHRKTQNIRAYRALTLERHEKEKAFDMEYYYTRHPDRRPKDEAGSNGRDAAGAGKKASSGGNKKTSRGKARKQ
ncbi:MAG: class C sortase, partial [Lachnospiraceae bacterium]|nr:class C sortase [Lachnospiraceae bacterium]